MRVFWIKDMRIVSEYFEVGNLISFYEEMDDLHPNGWFETYQEAKDFMSCI
jgi:hypothetical protein